MYSFSAFALTKIPILHYNRNFKIMCAHWWENKMIDLESPFHTTFYMSDLFLNYQSKPSGTKKCLYISWISISSWWDSTVIKRPILLVNLKIWPDHTAWFDLILITWAKSKPIFLVQMSSKSSLICLHTCPQKGRLDPHIQTIFPLCKWGSKAQQFACPGSCGLSSINAQSVIGLFGSTVQRSPRIS